MEHIVLSLSAETSACIALTRAWDAYGMMDFRIADVESIRAVERAIDEAEDALLLANPSLPRHMGSLRDHAEWVVQGRE